MNRRTFTGLSLAILSSFSFKSISENFSIKEVREGVYVYTERGGTILFTLTGEGWVVVDTQFPEQSENLIGELKKRESGSPIGLLINTHHHGDHSSGNIAFKGLVNEIIAHENSKINQISSAKDLSKILVPNLTYTSRLTKKIGDTQITLHYLGAAHTNGDSLVHFENANVVHMGDLLFNKKHPYIDKKSGANVANWINLLEQASNKFTKDTKYVFGHAGSGYDIVGTSTDLLEFRDYLASANDFVARKLKAGLSPESIKEIKEFDFDSKWQGSGIERVLNAIVEEQANG